MKVNHEDILEVLNDSGVAADLTGITNGASLSDAGVDSLDMSNFFLCLEEKFDIKIPDEDIDLLDSLDSIASYLQKI